MKPSNCQRLSNGWQRLLTVVNAVVVSLVVVVSVLVSHLVYDQVRGDT
jgi:hypothetical protein